MRVIRKSEIRASSIRATRLAIMTSSPRLDCWLVTNGVRASSMAARKTGCLSLNVAVSSKELHFLPGEINPIEETNKAIYLMARYDHEFDSGLNLSGNIGLRYSHTKRSAGGSTVFNQVTFSTDAACAATPPGQSPTPFCQLDPAIRQQARDWADGTIEQNDAKLSYDFVLPSFNAKLEVGNGIRSERPCRRA